MTNVKTKKPTRILIVNKYFYNIGGIESVVRDLATILDENLEIKILVLDKKAGVEKVGSSIVWKIKTQCVLFRMPFSFVYPFVFLREVQKADIVHFHSPFPLAEWTFVVFNWFFRYKAKVIVTYHSAVVRQKIFKRIHNWFLQRLFQHSSYVVVTSEPMAQNYPGLARVKAKIKVIPSGVQEPDVAGWKRDYNHFTHCLFVGRLVPYKGIDYLFQALSGTDIPLTIVGSGEMETYLRHRAQELGVEDRLSWKGSLKELSTAYKEASVFVLPSVEINETMGLVQAEAMAYGLPIINTALLTGVPWVARDNIEAITVKPKDVSLLRSALLQLKTDSALRARLGTEGQKRYKDIFTVESMKEKYLNLYYSVLKEV